MYFETHDFSALVDLTEIPFGLTADRIAVYNRSATATLVVSLDGQDVATLLAPGEDWGVFDAAGRASIWIEREEGTGDDAEQHVAQIEASEPVAAPEPPPPPEPEPPPPEPPPPEPSPPPLPPPPPEPDPLLAPLKSERYATIDARTRDLIARGFVHAGLTFSLSERAQIYWTNMFVARDLLPFPLVVNLADDSGTHDVADAAEVFAMYASAVGTVKAHLGSGTALKAQVRAATSVADLCAIVDARGL